MGGRTQHLQATPSPGPDHTAGLPSKMRVERRASVRHPLNEHIVLTNLPGTASISQNERCPKREWLCMPEHPNVALWRKVHQAFSRGDLETLRTHFTEDVVCRIGGSHPLSGERTGIGGLLAYMQALTEMAGGTLRLEPHE